VANPSFKVSDFVPWYLARRWASHRKTYSNAHAVWVKGSPERAEQILLTLLLDKTMVGPLYSALRPAVQKSQQALSAGLLLTPIPLGLQTAISRSFESGLEDTASAAALLPLMLVETPITVGTVDSYQSVGIHGARP
jgi:hypothetical protein